MVNRDDEYELIIGSLFPFEDEDFSIPRDATLVDIGKGGFQGMLDNLICTWFINTSDLTESQRELNKELLRILNTSPYSDEGGGYTKRLEEFLQNDEKHPDLEFVLNLKRGESKLTVLHAVSNIAIQDEAYDHSVSLLLKAGADPNKKNDRGKTPLHCATGFHSIDALLRAGAGPNVEDNEGKTPLHYVANIGCIGYVGSLRKNGVDLLLEKKANPNIRDKQGKIPFHCSGLISINSFLREEVDPNIKDNEGKTPLHYAAEIGCDESVNLLLKNGANSNICDRQGKTPLQIAIDNHHYHIEKCFFTDSQKILYKELHDIIHKEFYERKRSFVDYVDFTENLKKFLEEHRNDQDLKVILKIRDKDGKSEVLQWAKYAFHDSKANDELKSLFLEAGATDPRGLDYDSKEYLLRSKALWGNLIPSQQIKLDKFLDKVSNAQDMDKLEEIVDEAIKSGVRFNFHKRFPQYHKFNECNFTDCVMKRISELEKNPKVASGIVCKLVSRGAVFCNWDSMAVIEALESEFPYHITNVKEAYTNHVNRTLKLMEIVKSAATGELKGAELDNSTLRLEYSEDSKVYAAKITDGARDLELPQGKTGYRRDVIKIGKSEVEIITENGTRNYTDLADGSDIVVTFHTSLGELKVRLYPDKQNKDLIKVEVRNQEMLKELKDCEEEIGINCLFGGDPVGNAIYNGCFTKHGKQLSQPSETMSLPKEKDLQYGNIARSLLSGISPQKAFGPGGRSP